MSYLNCRQGDPHADCNGYIGPLDTFVCHCACHEREGHPMSDLVCACGHLAVVHVPHSRAHTGRCTGPCDCPAFVRRTRLPDEHLEPEPPRERATSDHVETFLCTIAGVDHDWRSHTYDWYGRRRTSWRCVWCHALACGDYGEPDPCMRPHHHLGPHRARSGQTWPLGGNREEVGDA